MTNPLDNLRAALAAYDETLRTGFGMDDACHAVIGAVRSLLAAHEDDSVPRHLRIALANAQRAFEENDVGRLATVNEDIQGFVDAAISWGRRLASVPAETKPTVARGRSLSDPRRFYGAIGERVHVHHDSGVLHAHGPPFIGDHGDPDEDEVTFLEPKHAYDPEVPEWIRDSLREHWELPASVPPISHAGREGAIVTTLRLTLAGGCPRAGCRRTDTHAIPVECTPQTARSGMCPNHGWQTEDPPEQGSLHCPVCRDIMAIDPPKPSIALPPSSQPTVGETKVYSSPSPAVGRAMQRFRDRLDTPSGQRSGRRGPSDADYQAAMEEPDEDEAPKSGCACGHPQSSHLAGTGRCCDPSNPVCPCERFGAAVAPKPAEVEQARDWDVRKGSYPSVRHYDDADPNDDEDGRAAEVDDEGWIAWPPGKAGQIVSGPETGPLGQCLADLALCSRGFLAWERVEWPSAAHKNAVAHVLIGCEGDETVDSRLTPATLDRVVTAVREVGRG